MSVIYCPLCDRSRDTDVTGCELVTIPARGIVNCAVCGPCFSDLVEKLDDDERAGLLHDGKPYPLTTGEEPARSSPAGFRGHRPAGIESEGRNSGEQRVADAGPDAATPGVGDREATRDAWALFNEFRDDLRKGDFRQASLTLDAHRYYPAATPADSSRFCELALAVCVPEVLHYLRDQLAVYDEDRPGVTHIGFVANLLRAAMPAPSPYAEWVIAARLDRWDRDLEEAWQEHEERVVEQMGDDAESESEGSMPSPERPRYIVTEIGVVGFDRKSEAERFIDEQLAQHPDREYHLENNRLPF